MTERDLCQGQLADVEVTRHACGRATDQAALDRDIIDMAFIAPAALAAVGSFPSAPPARANPDDPFVEELPASLSPPTERPMPSLSPVRDCSIVDFSVLDCSMPSEHECLRCRKRAEGHFYPFYVGVRQAFRIVHEERPFICNRCAANRLRFTPRVILVVAGPLFVLAFFGILGRILHFFLDGDPIAIGRFFRTACLLYTTGVFLRLAFKQLVHVRRQLLLRSPFPAQPMTRIAIQIRQKQLLKELHLSRSSAVFFTEAEQRQRMWLKTNR
jgi:hypothetical protein